MSMKYQVFSEQISSGISTSRTKRAQIYFDSSPGQSDHLFNPAELFLGSFSACMLKNVERFSEMLTISYKKATLVVKGIREDKPPRITEVYYEPTIETEETKERIDLLHRNLEKFGTIFNTVAGSCKVDGKIIKNSNQNNRI